MRAFVAVEVPEIVLDSLVAFQAELVRTGADLKLVERENLHFTVRFLGEISEPQAAEAKARLSKLASKGADVRVEGAGAFPNLQRPRVVWVGVTPEDEAAMAPIAESVASLLRGIGEEDERPFRAHITVARVRSSRNLSRLGEVLRQSRGTGFGTTRLAEVKLKSSVLTPSGPVYQDVGVYPLT